MPIVKLTEYECRKNLLPKVCMFCGEPAVTRKKKTFSWHPPWVLLLILIAVIVAAIVAMILTKKMTIRVPVCERHEGFWRRKGWTLGLTFGFLAVFGVGVLIFMGNQGPGNDDVTGLLCGGGVVMFLGWLIAVAIWSASGIRPIEITDDFAKMTNVHQDFIDALEDDRDRDREEEMEARRKKREQREARERSAPPPRQVDRRRDDDDLERRARN